MSSCSLDNKRKNLDNEVERIGKENNWDEATIEYNKDYNWYRHEVKRLYDNGEIDAANVLLYLFDKTVLNEVGFLYNTSNKAGYIKVLSVKVDDNGDVTLFGSDKTYTFKQDGTADFSKETIRSQIMRGIINESKKWNKKTEGPIAFFAEAGSENLFADREKFEEMEADLLKNPEKMQDLLENLLEIDGSKIDDDHAQYLRDTLSELIESGIVKNIPEMTMYLNDKAEKSGGQFVMKGEDKGIYLNISKHNAKAGNEMSASEAYVHELIHAMVEYARDENGAEIAGYLAQMMKIREKAMKVLTVEDLMPDNSINEKLERKIAEDRLDYFSSKEGLSEFMAYSVTNKKVIEKLKTIDAYTIKDRKNQRQLNKDKRRQNSFVSNAFDFIGELLKSLFEIALATFRVETINQTSDKAMFRLVKSISQMNNSALLKNQGFFRRGARAARLAIDSGNEMIHKFLTGLVALDDEKAREALDMISEKAREFRKNPGVFSFFKIVARHFYIIMRNDVALDAFLGMLNSIGVKRNGLVQMIINSLRSPDDLQRELEKLGLLSNKVDQSVENIAIAHGQMVLEGFEEELTREEQVILTDGVLTLDIQSIADYYDDDQLFKLYSEDSKYLEKEMEKIKNQLSKEELGNYYIAQSLGLGAMMVTGHGLLSQLQNATAIASFLNHDISTDKKEETKVIKSRNKSLIAKIDKLATLQAIKHSDVSTKRGMQELLKKDIDGVKNLIALHKVFNEDSKRRLFNDENWVLEKKGFTKSIDSSHDRIQMTTSEDGRKILESKGYKLVGEGSGVYVYHTDFDPQPTYNTAAMRFTDVNSRTNTMESVQHTVAPDIDDKLILEKKMEYNKQAQQQIDMMMRGEIVDPGVAVKYTEEDAGSVTVVPIMGANGKVLTYQYSLHKNRKAELLNQDRNVGHVFGRMMASIDDKVQSAEINEKVFELMVKDAIKNSNVNTRIGGTGVAENMKDYVEFSETNDDYNISNIYRMLPKATKKLITDYEEANDRKLIIRLDLLNNYLGFRSLSFANSALGKMAGPQMQRILRMTGEYWKDVVKITKVDYVMRTPGTFINNVISNLALCVQMGMPPHEVFKLQAQAANALTEFIKDENKLIKLKTRYKMKPTKGLEDKIKRLEENLNSSPLKTLMDHGFYQSIIEDVSVADLRSSNLVADKIDSMLSGAPEFIKDAGNQIYMSDKTSLLKLIVKGTQYSDFIARYALFNHLITKRDKNGNRVYTEKEALEITLDSFINYTNPDSAFLQWLNDMGLVMFTKFFLRIQNVLKRMSINRPLDLIGYSVISSLFGEISNIFEYNPYSKNYGTIFHNPFGILFDMFVPRGVSFVPEALSVQIVKNY